jgi:hypothetical protein
MSQNPSIRPINIPLKIQMLRGESYGWLKKLMEKEERLKGKVALAPHLGGDMRI